jgi:hypothetical protein
MDKSKLIAKMGYWVGELDELEDSLMALMEHYQKESEHNPSLARVLVGLLSSRTNHIIQSIESIRDKLCDEFCNEIEDTNE